MCHLRTGTVNDVHQSYVNDVWHRMTKNAKRIAIGTTVFCMIHTGRTVYSMVHSVQSGTVRYIQAQEYRVIDRFNSY